MKVNDLMTAPPTTCRPTDSLHEAAHRLWNEDCGSLPVVDGRNRLVGMITDRDIAMAGYFRNRSLSEIRVADTMSRQITTCAADDDLRVAISRMSETRVRRLPVCDDEGTLQGMIGIGDLLQEATKTKAIAQPVLEAIATISRPRREATKVLTPQPATKAATAAQAAATPAPREAKTKVAPKAASSAASASRTTKKTAAKKKATKSKKRR